MPFNELLAQMTEAANPVKAREMSVYMKNQFSFLGVPSPQRKEICRPFFKILGKNADFSFTDLCWESPFREFQYIAVDCLALCQQSLDRGCIETLKRYIITKSWWDTVDGLDRVVGAVALKDPLVNETLLEWARGENIWLRRVAIDHQLLRKEKTDRKLLEKIIALNLGGKEFFINKAIGWSLRDFSKSDPAWVRAFLQKYQGKMSPLSIREASKYLV